MSTVMRKSKRTPVRTPRAMLTCKNCGNPSKKDWHCIGPGEEKWQRFLREAGPVAVQEALQAMLRDSPPVGTA